MKSLHEKEIPSLAPPEISGNLTDIQGDVYRKIHDKIFNIIEHQRKNSIGDGIKGFILHGDVGLGKTMIGKIVAKTLQYNLIPLDCADIARAAYGASEEIIRKAFARAAREGHTIILFDDVEAIFPKRDWIKGQSWHTAQNNVFFHELDTLDTSKVCVILTTNRYDLVDKAVKDRLASIEFPYPPIEALIAAAEKRCQTLAIDPEPVMKRIRELIETIESPPLDDKIDEIAYESVKGGIDPTGETGRSRLYVFVRKEYPNQLKNFEAIYHTAVVLYNNLTSEKIRSFRNLEKIIMDYYLQSAEG